MGGYIDKDNFARYPPHVSGWVRRGRNPQTPPGPRGSSGKWAILGAAGLPARTLGYSPN